MKTDNGDWQRVTMRRPCPVCEKPDWCLYSGPPDAPTAAICARVELGALKRCGEAGWLHRLREDPLQPIRRRVRTIRTAPKLATPPVDFAKMARGWATVIHPYNLQSFAANLGLSVPSLYQLQVGWSPKWRAFSFPMTNAAGQVTGIRLRAHNGRKWSVPGGREGLFIPEGIKPGGRLLVCEGPTDTAALLDLGFPAVGRPSCRGGVRHIVELVKRRASEEVVIVADNDQPDRCGRRPGQDGAERLAAVLPAYVPAIKVIVPPPGIKDTRGWLQAGGTAADVQQAIDAAPVRRLRVTMGRIFNARRKEQR